MVEPDAKSPRSDRDEAAMDAARHAAGGMSFDDFKSLIAVSYTHLTLPTT